MNGLTYADSGVNIDAGNNLVNLIKGFARNTSRPGADGNIGGYGGVFDLKACGYTDPLLVAANDGVGTKLKIAIDSAMHGSIGIDLVAMCVNDLVVQGAEPLFFLDYYACGKLEQGVASNVIRSISEGCRQAGAVLLGGETAEMPGMYAEQDYDLAGFAVGAVERSNLLPRTNFESGDVILGLASSGLHSNGYSLVRKILEVSNLNLSNQSPFDSNATLAQSLLVPTRIYVKSVLSIASDPNVKALAHITGGGLPENLPRILPESIAAEVDLSKIPYPDIFRWLAELGRVEKTEMLRTFNCGVGMCVICGHNSVDEIAQILEDSGETVFELGQLTIREDAPVIFNGNLQGW